MRKRITLNMAVDAFPQSAMGQIEKLSFIKKLSLRGLKVNGQFMTFDQIFQELNKHPGSLLERLKLQEDIYFRSEKLCGVWANARGNTQRLPARWFFLSRCAVL